jgi:undecaprenyl-diphosphatase
MNFLQILILGVIQGAAELLPVSSSAHVIVAEKLMGLDPSSPEMTFLLVMLHTGTMFAVIVYFWNSWLDHYCSDAKRLGTAAKNILLATLVTVVIGFGLKTVIEKVFMHGQPKAEVEQLFSNLPLIGGALAAAGALIVFSGTTDERWRSTGPVDTFKAAIVGAVQGLCLPFRGFSRSGGTISTGLLLGIERRQIEEFSFALAVVLTPIAVGWELLRLVKAHPEITHGDSLMKLMEPGLAGMVCSFVSGWLALKLLSSLLEGGRWKFFGYYCFAAAIAVFVLAFKEPASAAPMSDTGMSAPSAATSAPDTNAPAVTPLAPATGAGPITPLPPASGPAPVTNAAP